MQSPIPLLIISVSFQILFVSVKLKRRYKVETEKSKKNIEFERGKKPTTEIACEIDRTDYYSMCVFRRSLLYETNITAKFYSSHF